MTKPILAANGKQLFHIEITENRCATLYVLAGSLADARADASELLIDFDDWETEDNDAYTMAATREPPPGTYVWTGGPDGEDVMWRTLSGAEELVRPGHGEGV